MRALAAGFAALLLTCLAFVSCLESPAPSLSCLGSFTCLLPLLAFSGTLIALSCCSVLALVLGYPAVLLLFPVLGSAPFYLAFIAV